MKDNIELFKQNILAQINMDKLPKSQQAMILDKMVKIVNQRLLMRVLNELEEAKKKEFEKILETGEDNEVENFLIKEMPNFLDMLDEEISKLKKDMLEHLKK